MDRHELRLVLRFGVREQFDEFAQRLYQEETARGWAPPRIWRATSGYVNQFGIEHDFRVRASMRSEKRGQPSTTTLAASAKSSPASANWQSRAPRPSSSSTVSS
jgi:hypothetical protein